MISRIRGELVEKDLSQIVIEVQGIGYQIFTPSRSVEDISVGAEVLFYIYDYLRENTHDLYGFLSAGERDLFELLIGVSGVGPKVGLAILNLGSEDQIRKAIASGNIPFIAKATGVGKKTAERICVELKDKVGVIAGELVDQVADEDEAYLALRSLGYTAAQSTKALSGVDSDLPTAERIKQALKRMG